MKSNITFLFVGIIFTLTSCSLFENTDVEAKFLIPGKNVTAFITADKELLAKIIPDKDTIMIGRCIEAGTDWFIAKELGNGQDHVKKVSDPYKRYDVDSITFVFCRAVLKNDYNTAKK
ncbi:MAG: hypothetical protein AAB895_00325 [Patescibacteria group bacterium]